MPGVSCLQPGWAHWTVCCLKGQEGELVVDTEEGLAMPAPAGRGTDQEAMEQTAPDSCLCADRMAHSFPQGHRRKPGQVSGEAVEQCQLALHSSCLPFTSC